MIFADDYTLITLAGLAPESTPTPNVGLLVPITDSSGWDVPSDFNLSQLDLLLSGNLPLPGIAVTGLAALPQLSTWSSIVTYQEGQTVIAGGALYVSLIGTNLGNNPQTSPAQWTPTISTSLPTGSAGEVLATPASASGTAQLRALVASDIPTLNQSTTGTAQGLSSPISEALVTNLIGDLAARELTANKGQPNGYASLNASGMLPSSQLPPVAISQTYVVASQAAMLALTADVGDVAIRSDVNITFILQTAPASTLAHWQQILTPASPVQSVNGQIGVVSLASTNLSDSAALARLSSPTFTGTPTAPTPATSDTSTTLATTAYVKAQATSFDTAGAATAALASAEAFSANASNLISGTVAPTRLPVATSTTFGVVEPDNATITVTSGVLIATTQTATGTAGGDLQGTYPNPTVARIGGVTPGSVISHAASDFDPAGAATTAQTAAIAASLQRASNLSDLASPATARTNLGFGTQANNITPTGTINSSNLSFTLPNSPNPQAGLMLFMQGLLMQQGVDYTLSGSAITYLVIPPTTGSSHAAFYQY